MHVVTELNFELCGWDVQFERGVHSALWMPYQNVLASTVGLPCIPFTTCELRTTSKFFLAQSAPAPSANCLRLASSVRNSPAALVPLPAIPAATRTTWPVLSSVKRAAIA